MDRRKAQRSSPSVDAMFSVVASLFPHTRIAQTESNLPMLLGSHNLFATPLSIAPIGSNTTTSAAIHTPSAAMQNPSVLATRATRKTTRFGVRDAKCNAAGAMHRVAWALQKSWRTRKKCGFPREKHDFSAEDKGFEPSTGFPAPDFESGS